MEHKYGESIDIYHVFMQNIKWYMKVDSDTEFWNLIVVQSRTQKWITNTKWHHIHKCIWGKLAASYLIHCWACFLFYFSGVWRWARGWWRLVFGLDLMFSWYVHFSCWCSIVLVASYIKADFGYICTSFIYQGRFWLFPFT